MKKILPILLFLATHALGKEIELKTTIDGVTVFQTGAQISRKGSVMVPAGESEIVVRDATALLKKESIEVKGEGSFTILSVNYQVNLADQKQDKTKIAELEAKEKDLRAKMEDLSVRIEVLRAEEDVLNNLQSVSTSNEGVTVEQVTKAQELLKTKMVLLKNQKLAAGRQIKELDEDHQKVQQQLATLKTPKQNVSYEIVIKVSSKAETKGEFSIGYVVPNARWYPTYDLRVKSVSEPMVIDYKANVTQQTGEDWKNIKLKLSTGDPSQNSGKPKIETWLLYLNQNYVQPQQQSNFYRYTDAKFTKLRGKVMNRATGEVLPFAAVMVDGTSIGTQTDVDGNYNLTLPENAGNIKVSYVGFQPQVLAISSEEMNIYLDASAAQLEEVTVTDGMFSTGNISEELKTEPGVRGARYSTNSYNMANTVSATPTPNLVSTEFNIDQPYTIISDKKSIAVTIQSIESKVFYQYYCAPRLDKDVFLTAQMTDWEQYNFLEGQANVFFEGTFIGSTLLDSRYLTDTLEIALGRDKAVKVERKKTKEYNKQTVFGNDRVASREWNIMLKNGKPQKIDIIIEDQFPLSADSKITVKQEEKGDGQLDDRTGIVTWKYQVDPGGTKEMKLKYSARYPKGTFIGLD